MPDMITHASAAYLLRRLLPDRRARTLFVAGTFFPDVLFKGFHVLFRSPIWFCEPTHAPSVIVLTSLLAAFLFREDLRAVAFRAILAGQALHVALDVLKYQQGQGVVLWAFPFSMETVEAGVLPPTSEAVGLLAPAALAVALALEFGVFRPLEKRSRAA